MRRSHGFTLVELIAVLVVLGIVAAMSTQFIVSSVDGYREGQLRQRLLSKGRFSLEQMTRYLRSAVPNSVRVSASGACVEFMPTVAGAFYEGQVADDSNSAPATASVTTSPFTIDLGVAEHVVIGALENAEIYSGDARIELGSISSGPPSVITFDMPHQFIRNSTNKRMYLGDDPKRFCLTGNDLLLYEGYGVTAAIADGDPGGADVSTISTSVGTPSVAFSLSNGTEDRSTALDIALLFIESHTRVALNQTVFIRNVP